MSKDNNYFSTLSSVNVSKKTEKKGRFTYLSWPFAVAELKKLDPTATWKVHTYKYVKRTKNENGTETTEEYESPYCKTASGCYVKVYVTCNNVTMEHTHPILDNRNTSVATPNSFQVNTSIMRCLTKCISLHGLGLYIYAGEDLPEVD